MRSADDVITDLVRETFTTDSGTLAGIARREREFAAVAEASEPGGLPHMVALSCAARLASLREELATSRYRL